ncbi:MULTISPECIES: acyclic terpene utilization AtuA family protein [Achromobacter]|jgi:hypothetical protein|uniref:Acyclic terpene utilisation N-terminal domain-containing protein n=1 Tax=Achromobacter mucicolens TaxID=1389922 RepID=A0ABM8LK62_9BURK|nr:MULTISPECIES: acyclic terpene utilization AtuA family protein [Achromobacter]AVG44084.1 DUF1446 domain-containing protein [Achromobacter insolitus]CAB3848214.1 hypothetical protein LMG3410_01631 [Achromobacter aegrifaciens]CAB3911891.1 hypothetical protein LMG3415_05016 [Achromobacter mucicolens]
MVKRVRLGAGSGFWGDAQDPAQELLERGNLDYLCFDYLAELTMALLQRQKLKRPDAGYVPDAVQTMINLLPRATAVGTKLISNGGGVNPRAAAQRIAEGARQAGLAGTRIALIEGDDMLDKLDDLIGQGVPLRNMDTGDDNFAAIRDRVVCANVYTDSSGITEGLEGEADVVIAGRVSDNALYVGPLAHEFGWRRDAAHIDRYAAAVTLGHIVECAAGCSGGMSSRFAEMPHMGRAGFPILDVGADAEAVVTKLSGTGGRIDEWTIKEHLVYEVGDPRRYLMPDAVADFTSLRLADEGQDRVRVSGVRGEAAPDLWKLVVGYQDGWIGETMAFFPWPYAYDRAVKARETMLERFERMGLAADQIHFDFVGLNTLHGPAASFPGRDQANELPEVGLRCAVRTRTAEEADKVRRAGTNLWIMGPGGTSFGTPMKPRPVISLWPTLIPRSAVEQKTEILKA